MVVSTDASSPMTTSECSGPCHIPSGTMLAGASGTCKSLLGFLQYPLEARSGAVRCEGVTEGNTVVASLLSVRGEVVTEKDGVEGLDKFLGLSSVLLSLPVKPSVSTRRVHLTASFPS